MCPRSPEVVPAGAADSRSVGRFEGDERVLAGALEGRGGSGVADERAAPRVQRVVVVVAERYVIDALEDIPVPLEDDRGAAARAEALGEFAVGDDDAPARALGEGDARQRVVT